MPAPLLNLCNLTIGYDKNIVSENLAGTLAAGSLTALTGRNGAGKTTLLRTIAGFQKPLSGRIEYNGINLIQYSNRQRARTISIVLTSQPQGSLLTVREVVEMGRLPHTTFLAPLSRHDKAVAEQSMELAGIADLAERRFSSLSDGQRGRAMIARALAQDTPIILLDEPTAHLDYVARPEIMSLLREIACQQQKIILLTTHEIELARHTCHQTWHITPNGIETNL